MAKKILVKGNIKRAFDERAAKIAIEHLGWVELMPPVRPPELLTKTVPPEIIKPVKLIVPPTTDKIPAVETTPEFKEVTPEVEKIKKTRKPRKK